MTRYHSFVISTIVFRNPNFAKKVCAAMFGAAQVPPLRNFLLGKVPQGEGPDPERRARSWFRVDFIGEGDGRVFPVDGMVEKPKPGTEPSNLTILGRYILQPEIFGILSAQEKGAGGEIQLTDAMLALLKRQPFSAVKYEGRTFDCGSKVGFLTANVAYALARPDIAEAFKAEIKKLL